MHFFIKCLSAMLRFHVKSLWKPSVSPSMDEFPIRRNRRQFIGHQMAVVASQDLEEFWQASVVAADELGLDSLHIKFFNSKSSIRFFDRRWCVGDTTPFMTGDTWPGLLAGFTITGENGITTELLFEREEPMELHSTTYRRIGLLKEAIAHRISQFSIEGFEAARESVLIFRDLKKGGEGEDGLRISHQKSI